MTKVKTTPEFAAIIIEAGSRKITTEKNENVFWININNQTLLAGNKKSSRLYNCEDVELYINVPSGASKVF